MGRDGKGKENVGRVHEKMGRDWNGKEKEMMKRRKRDELGRRGRSK